MVLGINERAWSGINIMVFGKTPLLPMKIEQAMAAASPSNEVRIDSFEDYNQAYDFTKNQKNVGLIFIQENSDGPLSADTFKQLAIGYESKGWPCFGVLVHENSKSMMGYLSMQKNKNLISYISSNDLTSPEKTFATLNDVWINFVDAIESNIIPQKLQETLLCLASPILSNDSFIFRTRVTTTLIQNLNISWLEMLALKWQPVVQALGEVNPDALKPNTALTQITSLATVDKASQNILSAAKSKIGLVNRISTIVNILDESRIKNTLEIELSSVEIENRPGAAALIKQIGKCKEGILQFAFDPQIKSIRTVS